VSVTQAGQDILVSLERILVEVEGVTNAGHDLATLRRGVVTVAAVPSVAATLLPPALGEFSKSYPGIRIRFRDDVAMNFVDLVSGGEKKKTGDAAGQRKGKGPVAHGKRMAEAEGFEKANGNGFNAKTQRREDAEKARSQPWSVNPNQNTHKTAKSIVKQR